jgi:tRNA(fMet)-specific endonuclease VapC
MAMKVAIDANRYSDFCRGNAEVAEQTSSAERIYLPLIVLGELRAGFQAGKLARQNERILVQFLRSPRVRLLLPDEQTTFHYANLFAQLRRQATPIPTNDLWIAAMVIQHDLILLTRDAHFKHLPQLVQL